MSAPKVRADHDSLGQIAQIFSQQADASRRTLQNIKRNVDTLQGGDWIGQGANAFYREMHSDVIPALQRLVRAMEESGRVTQQISRLMQTAEDDVSRLFNRGGRGDADEFGEQSFRDAGAATMASFGGASGGSSGGSSGGAAGAMAGAGAMTGGASSGDSGGSSGGAGDFGGAAGVMAGAGAMTGGASSGDSGGSSGGGSGGSSGGGAGGGNPLISTNPNQLFTESYLNNLAVQSFEGANSPELRDALLELSKNPTGEDLEKVLRKIAKLRGKSYEEIKSQYEKFLKVRGQAQSNAASKGLALPPNASGIQPLCADNHSPVPDSRLALPPNASGIQPEFLGSTQQMQFRQIVGEAFGIDPVFGALLNPAGGLGGPDAGLTNFADGSVRPAAHDAAAYLSTFHNAGPGVAAVDKMLASSSLAR
ncbi:MAG: WXG100 family type VII secretion target [Chloroflexi bacterium]|nr:WXG100 family type VII secretion target [Chloroflexota bacterium]